LNPSPRTYRLAFGLICLVYLFRLAAHAAVTPIGEALDVYGHLGYIVFLAERGRAPRPTEVSMPAWLEQVRQGVPGPDGSMDGQRYRAWAETGLAARAAKRAALNVVPTPAVYAGINNQSQHPPLYYGLMSWLYRLFPVTLALDARLYLLGLASIALSAIALPGLYRTLRLSSPPTVALLCLLAIVWFPNTPAFLGRITNDTLALPLVVWGLYFCLLLRRSARPVHLLLAGALLLAATFTKTYALTLLPVYALCALASPRGRDWRRLVLLASLLGVGLALIFAFNVARTGHLIPLSEIRLTSSASPAARVAALFQVDPVWFVGGLVKGFWWLGDWSFVSPAIVFFLPLLIPAVLMFVRPPVAQGRDRLALRSLWPHYAALAFFTAGLWQHAALFTLLARLEGQVSHSGNEGWYANVLIGSVAVILLVLLQRHVSGGRLRRVLAAVIAFFIVWGFVGQAALFMYWSGQVALTGRLRAVRWDQFLRALFDAQAWQNWVSLPGLIPPVMLTFALPMLLACAATGLVLWMLWPMGRDQTAVVAAAPEPA
jgi:hypothetical protein